MSDKAAPAQQSQVDIGKVQPGEVAARDNVTGDIVHIPMADYLSGKYNVTPVGGEELSEGQNEAKYGDLAHSLGTAALGFADASTLNTAGAVLDQTGLLSGAKQKAMESANPGNYALGSLPGYILDPAGVYAKLGAIGGAAEKAASPLIESGIGKIASAEASPVANAILTGAGKSAVGSSVEGALFGVGNAIHEATLGDAKFNGETVFRNMYQTAGLFGLLGGTAGGALSGTKSFGKSLLDSIQEATGGALKEAMTAIPSEAGAAVEKAAADLGLPVGAEMVSDNPIIKKAGKWVRESESAGAQAYREGMQDAHEQAVTGLRTTVGDGTPILSDAAAGKPIQDALVGKLKQAGEYFNKAYDAIFGEYGEAVPVSQNQTKSVAANIRKEAGSYAAEGTQVHTALNRVADAIENVQSLGQLRQMESSGGANGAKGFLESSLGIDGGSHAPWIREKLRNLQESSIEKLANGMKNPEAKAKVLDLIDQIRTARKEYAEYAQGDLKELQKSLISKNARGGQIGKTANKIAEMEPGDLPGKLFHDAKPEQIKRLVERYPDEMKQVIEHRKQEMIKESSKFNNKTNESEFNHQQFYKKYEKMEPEIRDILYSKSEQAKIGSYKTYLSAFPKDFNPGKSADGSAFPFGAGKSHGAAKIGAAMVFGHSPVGAAVGYAAAHVGGNILDRMLGDALKFTPAEAVEGKIATYTNIEKARQQVEREVNSGAKSIFTPAEEKEAVTIKESPGKTKAESKEEKIGVFKKMVQAIRETASNPDLLMDRVHSSTQGFKDQAPNTGDSLQQTTMRAIGFLSSKVPQVQESFMGAEHQPSMQEVSDFNRYFGAIHNPTGVLEQIRKGTLTPQYLETIQTVYPSLYKSMKDQVTEEMFNYASQKKKQALPYQRRMMLSMFLGQPLDQSISPNAILANQQAQASISARNKDNTIDQAAIKPTQGGLSNLTIASRLMTGTQSVAEREDV